MEVPAIHTPAKATSTLTDPLDPDCAPAASDPAVFAGAEAGGTKWVCARGTGPGDLTEVEVIPMTTPPETPGRVVEFFKRDSVRVVALGVGSFGPVDVRVGSETFGWITKTAKPGWSNTKRRRQRAGTGERKRCALATASRPNSSMISPPGRSRRATLRSGS